MIDLLQIPQITRFKIPGSGNDATRVTTYVQVLTNKLKWTATDLGLHKLHSCVQYSTKVYGKLLEDLRIIQSPYYTKIIIFLIVS